MIKDAEQTKARLLAAAAAEFAQFGIAGARVDRIASAAKTNKQMIYAYFGNKDQLFDRVFSSYVSRSLERIGFDAEDLPAYAGRMFDDFEDDPAALRLSTWYRLERPKGPGLDAVVAINRTRVERLRRAQREGVIGDDFEPVALLALIQAIVTSWATTNPELGAAARTKRDDRRSAVVEAVRRLVRPAGSPR